MRHRVKTERLGRFSSYRKATIKSIVSSILINQRIITTKAKAKSARRTVEKIITLGKKGTLFAKRRAFSLLCDHKLVKTLFDQIAPKFADIKGGYTRIIPYHYQRGDNASLVIFELTKSYKEKKPEKKIEEEKETKVAVKSKQEPGITKKEKAIQTEVEIKQKQDLQKEEQIKIETKEKKEPLKEEKPQARPEEEKQKKPEIKRPKKFFTGFKGFFKKERDSL